MNQTCKWCLKHLDINNFYINKGKTRVYCKACYNIPNKNRKKDLTLTERQCKSCEQILDITKFKPSGTSNITGENYFSHYCIPCFAERRSEREKIKIPTIKNCKACLLDLDISKFSSSKAKMCVSCREFKIDLRRKSSYNPDRARRYRQSSHGKAKRKIYMSNKRKNPSFRLRSNISNTINKSLRGTKLGESILKYLNYSIEDLKIHLELQFSLNPNINWNNYGSFWELDHIIPHSEFKYESMNSEEFRACWSLFNLRPLNARQNLLDGVRRTRHLIK